MLVVHMIAWFVYCSVCLVLSEMPGPLHFPTLWLMCLIGHLSYSPILIFPAYSPSLNQLLPLLSVYNPTSVRSPPISAAPLVCIHLFDLMLFFFSIIYNPTSTHPSLDPLPHHLLSLQVIVMDGPSKFHSPSHIW